MRVEEKRARAYHRDLSWRKVLVRLEPDAHNNIVVRRMFANAYGWPVIKHLCDTHFGDTFAAETRDEKEPATDRAKSVNAPVREDGEHVQGQEDIQPPLNRSESEMRESADELERGFRSKSSEFRERKIYVVELQRRKNSSVDRPACAKNLERRQFPCCLHHLRCETCVSKAIGECYLG